MDGRYDDESEEEDVTRKYRSYRLEVDPLRNDRAVEVLLADLSRPHMRAFHCAWWSCHVGFVLWFSISPLLSEIEDSLELTDYYIYLSNIAGISATVMTRFLLGPLCHTIGPRVLTSCVLAVASVAVALIGTINGPTSLILIRSCLGIAGGTVVTSQYWATRMFTHEIIGTTTAMIGGWGNLGAVVTQLLFGNNLIPMFKRIAGSETDLIWRTTALIPSAVGFAAAIIVYRVSEDDPRGTFAELREKGVMPHVSARTAAVRAVSNPNTWILALQYAGSFGVELTMQTASAQYFVDTFDQNRESAFALAAVFGWMNILARAMGGYMSDKLNSRYGMRGRLLTQLFLLLSEAVFVVLFAQSTRLFYAIATMIIFSGFVQAAGGSTFAIVPYVDPPSTGAVMGIVGGCGSAAAIVFSIAFRYMDYQTAFLIMSLTVFLSAGLTCCIFIKDYASLGFGEIEGAEFAACHDVLYLERSETTTATSGMDHSGKQRIPAVKMSFEEASRAIKGFSMNMNQIIKGALWPWQERESS